MKKTFTYIKNFLKDKNVASVTPSSRFCVKRICRHIDFSQPRFIVEYGPGTGVYTRYLSDGLKSGSVLHAFELNNDFADKLKPMENEIVTIHHAGAEKMPEILGNSLIGKVDYILSGIPFSFLSKQQKNRILEQSHAYLRPGGLFLAYQTSKHLEEPLRNYFELLELEFEPLNIPPMTIYIAAKGDV